MCTLTENSIYWKLKNKIFNLFEAPNQHDCCVTLLWMFLQVLIRVLYKWLNKWLFKCDKLTVHFKLTLDMIFLVLYEYLNCAADKTIDGGPTASTNCKY